MEFNFPPVSISTLRRDIVYKPCYVVSLQGERGSGATDSMTQGDKFINNLNLSSVMEEHRCAILIFYDKNKILLQDRRLISKHGGGWGFFGGT